MVQYEFLKSICKHLNVIKPWCNCQFRAGQSREEINRLEAKAGIRVPEELKEFYQVSYGATLCMYRILTIDEMIAFRNELSEVYSEHRRKSLLPFAYVVDVGDYVAFDVSIQQGDKPLIVDGFHEFSPDEWKPICYGFAYWLRRLAENGFEPFWLGDEGSREGVC